jgi:alpha-beta hydrolase superfamily lysophospholipase
MTTEVARSIGVKSVAQWLGSSDRPLFSWLDLPDDDNVVGAAVLCPSMGLEGAYSARALRDLAHRLAASRWAVLRVDYAGMGDSSGNWTDPDLVAEWRHGVRDAIEYVRTLEAPRIAVIGLRIGATLAAAALTGTAGVDDLVLWDPCATGKSFLREQRALWAFRKEQAVQWGTLREGELWGSGEPIDDGSFEPPGAMFSARTVSDLQSLAISPNDPGLASRELVLTREGRKLDRTLAERRAMSKVEFSEISGQEVLFDADAITPEPTLQRIVGWLTEPTGRVARVETPKLPAEALHRADGRPAVLERPLVIGSTRLFGMLSEPEDPVDRSAPTVIFLNAGRIGHHGPARLWVDLARSWSSEGLRCLRLDLSGLGDSPARPGRTENVEFPADGLDDLRDVRGAIVSEFGSDVVLVGLCSGGYHAIESALDEPAASVCVINPALTYYRWSRHPYRRFEPDEGEGFQDRQAWAATRPWVSRLMVRLAHFQGAARKIPGAWWVMKRLLVTASPAGLFDRLSKSGVPVLVIAGSDESRQLRQGEQRRYRVLSRKGAFRMETIPNLEHTLLERTGRDRVSECVHAWVMGTVRDRNASVLPHAVGEKSTGHLAPGERDGDGSP